MFQFLMVRLKDIRDSKRIINIIVSIPYGTIKRYTALGRRCYYCSVSIPYGTIKSIREIMVNI